MWKRLLLLIIRKTIQEEVERLIKKEIKTLIKKAIEEIEEKSELREVDNGVEFRVPKKGK